MKQVFFALGIIVLDQISKTLVVKYYPQIVSENNGGAFSFLNGFASYQPIVVFLVLAIVAALIFIKQTRQLGVFLILAGALSNLIDRILRGSVVDFINVSVWPSFNLADIAISAGLVSVAIYLFYPTKKSPSRGFFGF